MVVDLVRIGVTQVISNCSSRERRQQGERELAWHRWIEQWQGMKYLQSELVGGGYSHESLSWSGAINLTMAAPRASLV